MINGVEVKLPDGTQTLKSARTQVALRSTWRCDWIEARRQSELPLVDTQSAVTPDLQPDSAETLVADAEPVQKTTGVFSVHQLLEDPLEFEVTLNEALNRIKACLRLSATELLGRMIKAKRGR